MSPEAQTAPPPPAPPNPEGVAENGGRPKITGSLPLLSLAALGVRASLADVDAALIAAWAEVFGA